jgi:hypothetical protein
MEIWMLHFIGGEIAINVAIRDKTLKWDQVIGEQKITFT